MRLLSIAIATLATNALLSGDVVTVLDEDFDDNTSVVALGGSNASGSVSEGKFKVDLKTRGVSTQFQNFEFTQDLSEIGITDGSEISRYSLSLDAVVVDNSGIKAGDQLGFLVKFYNSSGGIIGQREIATRIDLTAGNNGRFAVTDGDFAAAMSAAGVNASQVSSLGIAFFTREGGAGSGNPNNNGTIDLHFDNLFFSVEVAP